ncbi:hypothetical protein [Sinorhizobium meliloti]|uniref:hypothetical protein n=1 Tax=Rhizobium meliloti TaxID=382 RepID=UPI00299E19A3|nr:hypothetical protein [Sinorhizobium meliloti]MDW9621737.1 hypothetical protein [Sinorhizobium meliloti]MDX0173457.1 hypothetical protein [Sinorhizobium meliloti]
MIKAASDASLAFIRDGIRHVGAGLVVEADEDGGRSTLAPLKFRYGRLVEWVITKVRRLRPVDRVKAGLTSQVSRRDPVLDLKTEATTPSPMHASPLPRNVSDRTVLPPMLDPLTGVEANRELLRSLGVDWSGSLDKLLRQQSAKTPVQTALEFLGGVSRPSGYSSSGANLVRSRIQQGDFAAVLEEVAARGTLKSIGYTLFTATHTPIQPARLRSSMPRK